MENIIVTNALNNTMEKGIVEIFHFMDTSYHQVFIDGNEVDFYSDQAVYSSLAKASMLNKLSKQSGVKVNDLKFYEYDLEDFKDKYKSRMSINDYLEYDVIIEDFKKFGTPIPNFIGQGANALNDYF